MLINAIRAENLKSRHSHMWVAVLILPLLTAAIGAIIYGINADCHLCVLFVAAGTHKSQLEQPYDNAGFPVNHFHCEAGCADKIYSGRTSSFDGVYHYRGKGCVSV